MDDGLLTRIEDAGLNASAPPQQRWIDGWIVRYSPGKARRARCINAVASGRLSLDDKLRLAAAVYAAADLPMILRVTPYTLPPELESSLAARGWTAIDDTQVMLCPELRLPAAEPAPLPSGCHWVELDALRFAQAVGELRASPALECQAHAQRLAASPVPHHGLAICSDSDGAVLACGQYAQEAELVGLYDVMTCESARRRGLATLLCERLLSRAVTDGADVAYLQMAADNDDARGVYRRLGFVDAYRYHYLQLP